VVTQVGSLALSDFLTQLTRVFLAAAASLPGVTQQILSNAVTAMNWGYQRCFKIVYLSTLGFGVPGILAAFFVKNVSQHFTDHTAVSLSPIDDEGKMSVIEEKV
jgi:hypothetical protein